MKAFTQLIDSILEKILVVLFGIMILVITWQVFSRFVLNSPSSFTEELSTYILIWISLLGATYAFRKKSHIGIFHDSPSLKQSILPDMIQELIDLGINVEPVMISEKWCEIDTLQDLDFARKVLKNTNLVNNA